MYEVLIEQIEGMVNIEIGNYLYKKTNGTKWLHYDRWRRIRYIC